MCRNKTLCPRLPKFKDTRKIKQTPVFNGWTDEREPRSPLADLFSQLTPIFQNLKRKRGALTFPPRPPHPELDQPPETCLLPRLVLRSSSEENAVFARDWLLPELSDFNCSKRELRPVVGSELTDLAATIRLPVNSGSKYQARAPVLVENERHFDRIMAEAGDGLVVVDFFATWCSPCKIIGPLFRMLALKTPTMRFVKVDIDVCDKLAKSLHVHAIPTIKVFRGGGLTSAYNNVGTIEGADHFIVNFMTVMAQVSNKEEAAFLATQVDRTRVTKGGYAEASKMGCDLAALQGLASSPMASLGNFVQEETKQEALVDSELLFDIENHESAKSAVARSMMQRIKTDVKAWANKANSSSKSKVADLYDSTVSAFFDGDAAAEAKIRASLATLQRLLSELRTLRDVDARAVQDAIPLLEGSANFVGIEDVPKVELKEGATAPLPTEQDLQRISKLKYLLRRQSGQESTMWLTFLFGALLSSKASIDMKRLNPYLADSSIQVILDLVTLTILRTNRVGHANRCIAASLNLVSMIEKVLELPQAERQLRKQALMPSVIQSGEALARQLVTRRWFVHDQSLNYDPRYLVFEFTWNIMLRKKQVEIVDNFMATLRENKSKVKQMIMGAGKTTVVAPLLALMLADGSSLILSVVPRALMEMSRKLMRETFATIMQKRIYTLKYDRSTIVQPAMCRSLQNAVRNRGIVVCTPTTIKSVMLSYIEVLQGLTDCKKNSLAARLKELSVQAVELSKMLRLFREGVMLLDEVDLILHPLKSELNFPIGEKFDLDVSEQGERWGLPIHLMDAMFFTRTGKITTFEQRGTAVDILRRLANAVEEGFRRRALQRLPHITLLNPAFYHQHIKPVMAEWAYLWLQKQHLHGISRQEAMQYLLEGATARSAATTKIQIIDLAINKVNIETGQRSSEPEPTPAHTDAMAMDPVKQRPRTASQVSEADSIRLKAELEQLTEAKTVSQQQQQLIHTVCDLDTQLDRTLQESGAAIAHIQKRIAGINKRIEEMEFPQDDSLDNAVVVWLSQAFNANVTVGASGIVNPVHSACTMLEDSGFTVKRCDVLEEAVDRVRDLQQSGRLRCVIAGGDGVVGCSIGCNDDHSNLNCLVCRKPWGHHNGHNCPKDDRQGSFPTSITTKTNQLDYLGFMKELTSTDTAFARKFSAVPKARTAMFNAGAVMAEPERLAFWRLGVIIPEDTKDLMTWTNMLPAWPKVEHKEEEEDEPVPAAADAGDEDMPTAPTLTRQVSVGSLRLQKLRKQLEVLEKQKLALLDVEDTKRKSLRAIIADKHRLLIESIDNRVGTLQKAVVRATALGNTGFKAIAEQRTAIGPSSGRDAALALAWLALNDKQSGVSDKQPELPEVSLVSPKSGRAPPPPPPRSSPPPPPPSLVDQKILASCVRKLQDEILYLGQTALAAKVVAFVSLVHKKLLNLSHDWLKCFLPHCLSKVNRVSFGLLNDSEAKEALILDPHVPRSRLKLAVPFVGKDVPSQSSEFAHPEVIIGLTVLAYRYSGLRREEDFADIIDSMTTEFSHEIGPARDRASSRRHEAWVLEAGGTIRGIKQPLKGTIPLEQQQHTVLSASADDDSRLDSKLAENYQSLLTHVSSSSQTTLPSPLPAASDATPVQASEPMDDFPSVVTPPAEIDDPTAREVVQLKYLQKSNDEQMIKLYQLWMKEPNVIHHYLCKTIFPGHMRHQMFKISASGQSVGGDMLVGRRVGFSGTPSDLLPKELGKCDYETGDDGKMLTTVLDTSVMDSEHLPGNWDVEFLLQRVANAEKPRFHSLIDTGALITGYTNEQVARELLKRGLSWCDGVVFLDDQDKQQVLVRATDRVVNADQCGISLERRFAFYDQIHTTGMDISHVVNARAVITLGKDMVFRDYVQGAFRMRGIGAGQTITVYIIPEVAELIQRELTAASVPGTVVNPLAGTPRGTLVDIAAWLVINSMRSEQVQWNMLCIQNVANIYRKNAFQTIYESTAYFTGENKEHTAKYDPNKSLALFSEAIDFSLEAAVPDPVPFGDKLRVMLEENSAFIATAEQHEVGHSVLVEVGEHALLDESPQRLETEQEREQEQEQQKEVRARRDQQVEVEKFVDREYSRNEEAPRPWHISMLAKYATAQKADELDLHPFYPLHEFRLRHQEPLKFPGCLYVSRNYFNPQWAGLRRVKNVVMVLEWAPNSSNVRLLTPEECTTAVGQLTPIQEQGLAKAYQLLSFHGHQGGANDDLGITKLDLYNAVNAATDSKLTEPQMDEIISKFGKNNRLSLAEFRHLLSSGHLRREEKDRFWVAVSLAEAETLRRLMHIRLSKPLVDGAKVEAALRYSPTCSPNAPLAGDSGDIFDTSLGWRGGTKAFPYHEAVAHNCFRFFDSEMHFTDPGLNVGVRALQACTPNERERFFTTTIGCRRRMERKWQETPVAKILTVPDEWAALKYRAFAVFMREAITAKQLTLWEAFTVFDADNNGLLSPAEFYGALRWLNVPDCTPEDVVDFITAADLNHDNSIDYKEYIDAIRDPDEVKEGEEDENSARTTLPPKIEPYGGEELRELMIKRKREEMMRARDETLRRQAYQQTLDMKLFEEEFKASQSRKGGANPRLYPGSLPPNSLVNVVEFRFTQNDFPLRLVATGKHKLQLMNPPPRESKKTAIQCPRDHELSRIRRRYNICNMCSRQDTQYRCTACDYDICQFCFEAKTTQLNKQREGHNDPTSYLSCSDGCSFTVQVPAQAKSVIQNHVEYSRFTVTMELRIDKLPLSQQIMALLRFSPSEMSRSRRRNIASVYLDSHGCVSCSPEGAGDDDDNTNMQLTEQKGVEGKSGPSVRAREWCVVTVAVDAVAGHVETYINGELSSRQTGREEDLTLKHKLVVFGGGKRGESKGGCVRRIFLHDRPLSAEEVRSVADLCLTDIRGRPAILWLDLLAIKKKKGKEEKVVAPGDDLLQVMLMELARGYAPAEGSRLVLPDSSDPTAFEIRKFQKLEDATSTLQYLLTKSLRPVKCVCVIPDRVKMAITDELDNSGEEAVQAAMAAVEEMQAATSLPVAVIVYNTVKEVEPVDMNEDDGGDKNGIPADTEGAGDKAAENKTASTDVLEKPDAEMASTATIEEADSKEESNADNDASMPDVNAEDSVEMDVTARSPEDVNDKVEDGNEGDGQQDGKVPEEQAKLPPKTVRSWDELAEAAKAAEPVKSDLSSLAKALAKDEMEEADGENKNSSDDEY